MVESGRERRQSSVGKKMAAVHFTTIPCEPNTACKLQGKPHFCSIFSCATGIVYAGSVFLSFLELRIMGKCTSPHLFSYGGLGTSQGWQIVWTVLSTITG